jgi:hypothetical protein
MASHVDDPTLETPGNYTTTRDVTDLVIFRMSAVTISQQKYRTLLPATASHV